MLVNNQQVKKIGAGEFSKAYRVIDSDIVYILTSTSGLNENANTKEIYCHIENPHVPYMRSIDSEVYIARGYHNIYETKFYHPLTNKNIEAWKQYLYLKKTWAMFQSRFTRITANWHAIVGDFIEYVRNDGILPDSLIEALELIESWSSAFGPNYCFEFSPRNLKVDDNGTLILLDIVFYRKCVYK